LSLPKPRRFSVPLKQECREFQISKIYFIIIISYSGNQQKENVKRWEQDKSGFEQYISCFDI